MKSKPLANYAWGLVAYNLFVILWGAYVRATGSGAGCGNHWPTCDGAIIPRSPQLETIIEFGHRLTSGLDGLLVIGLVVWAFRVYGKGHQVRIGATWSLIFIIIEGLLGAALVRFDLVVDNASLVRAVVVGVHLVNTFILLAWLTLTAWWASGGAAIRWQQPPQRIWLIVAGLVAVALLGATGAVTALGDTLFPDTSLFEGLQQDFSPTVNILKRLRIIHPFLALLIGLYMVFLGSTFRGGAYSALARKLATGLIALFFVQLAVGIVNVILLAPIPIQLVHLLLADLVWIVLVLLGAEVLSQPQPVPDNVNTQHAMPTT